MRHSAVEVLHQNSLKANRINHDNIAAFSVIKL